MLLLLGSASTLSVELTVMVTVASKPNAKKL
jgi:hypothetical protein